MPRGDVLNGRSMEKKEIPPKALAAAICSTRVFTDAIIREDSCWKRVCPDGEKRRAGLGGLSSSF